MNETETLHKLIVESRRITIATYTAVAKCAHEVADLSEPHQVMVYKQIIRELNLMIDDILIEGDTGEI